MTENTQKTAGADGTVILDNGSTRTGNFTFFYDSIAGTNNSAGSANYPTISIKLNAQDSTTLRGILAARPTFKLTWSEAGKKVSGVIIS
jgi:hypothetical protein